MAAGGCGASGSAADAGGDASGSIADAGGSDVGGDAAGPAAEAGAADTSTNDACNPGGVQTTQLSPAGDARVQAESTSARATDGTLYASLCDLHHPIDWLTYTRFARIAPSGAASPSFVVPGLSCDPTLATSALPGHVCLGGFCTPVFGICVAHSSDDGMTWGTPSNVSGGNGGGGDRPWIAAAPDGTVYASYTNFGPNSGSPDTLYLSRGDGFGTTWTPPLTPDQSENSGGDGVVVDAQGRVHLAYNHKIDGAVYVRSDDRAQSITKRIVLSPSVYVENIAMDEAGDLYVLEMSTTTQNAFAVQSSIDGGDTWSPAVPIAGASVDADVENRWLSAGGQQQLVMVWYGGV